MFNNKCFIRCLLSVLLYNYVIAHNYVIDSYNYDYDLENQTNEKLSAKDLYTVIAEPNVKKLEVFENIPDPLDKINQRLDALEKAPKLEEQVKNLKDIVEKLPASLASFNTTLDTLADWTQNFKMDYAANVSVKIQESLDNIIDRLDNLENTLPEKSTPLDDSAAEKSDFEKIVFKLENDIVNKNRLYNKNLFKSDKLKLDDLDYSMINQTECKFLSMFENDFQLIYTDPITTSHISAAYQYLEMYRHIQRADYETHMAIRSTGDVYILMWEGTRPDIEKKIDPDYEIGLGVRTISTDMMSSLRTKNDSWKGQTPKLLSPDQYTKFYIKASNDTLEFGTGCDKAPIHVHKTTRRGSISTIAFLTKAKEETKILFDCPARTCADSP